MANLENLQSYGPGRSGNPAGRPKGSRNRSTVAREFLSMRVVDKRGADENFNTSPITGKIEDLDVEEMLTLVLIARGRRGDVQAIKTLLDSAYGKPTIPIEVSNPTPLGGRDPREMSEDELRESIERARALRGRRLAEAADDAELAEPEGSAELMPAAQGPA